MLSGVEAYHVFLEPSTPLGLTLFGLTLSDLYISGRRFRKNPHPSLVFVMRERSISASTISSPFPPRASTAPKSSHTNDPPKNESASSVPTRFTAATETVFAIAWPRCTPSHDACIPRSKVLLLMVTGIFGNMRLAVGSKEGAVGAKHSGGVVELSIGSFFKQRTPHKHNAVPLSRLRKESGGFAWKSLSTFKRSAIVLFLAKIGAEKELRKADDSGTLCCSLLDHHESMQIGRASCRERV